MTVRRVVAAGVLGLAVLTSSGRGQGMSVFLSVDMEGIAGVVSGDQLGPGSFEYDRFRQFMTREALAAIDGAREAGATRFLVADAHGNGQNLLIELFPTDVRIVRSWPRRYGMVGGIDSSFDAAIFVGYHSSTNAMSGVRAHTFSSARLTRVALNGKEVSEGVWNAALIGEFGVPLVMITGDESAIAEVRAAVGTIEAAEVKRSMGFHSATTMTPEAAQSLIRETARRAVRKAKQQKPYRLGGPVTLDVSFKSYLPSEVLSYLKGVQRTDAHSIRITGANMREIADFMVFLTNYKLELEP